MMRGLAVITAMATLTCAAGSGAVEYFVAPDGRDTWSGRSAKATGSDGPFRTLERAREAIRSTPAGVPVTVTLRGGVYELGASFAIGREEARGEKLILRSRPGEVAIMRGGKAVNNWRGVTDADTLARLPEAARSRVICADLKALGIGDLGRMRPRGFGRPVEPAGLELFFRGKPMTMARWPNREWASIKTVPNGQHGGQFTFEGGMPERWKDLSEPSRAARREPRPPTDVWVHGYWTYDWADTYEKVAALDVSSRTVTTVPPHGQYGYTAGKRFYFLNVLEELDEPGEWYLDRQTSLIYFWPPEPPQSGDAVVSVLEQPLIVVRDAANVTIEGLCFEAARGSAVEVVGGSGNAVRSCEFRCLGNDAVHVTGGTKHVVADCHIHDIGEAGIRVSGGDRKTLAPGGHRVLRNHIHNYSLWCRTYRPAIGIDGVGHRIANNAIHDAPHNAILFGGNDHVIELNDISRVCLQTGDAGAIYAGRNMTMRGTVIRWNYFHDISRVIGDSAHFVDVMSVYLDDCFCGTTICGNVFVRAGRAAMIGGGRDNTIENNVFVECNPSVHVDSRGTGWASFWFDGRDPFIMNGLKEVNHDQPPYSVRYPKLVGLLQDQPGRAKGNAIVRNVSVGGRWIDMLDGLTDKEVRFEGNVTEGDPGFVDIGALDLRLKPDSPLKKLGFRPIPVKKIGIPDQVPTPWAGRSDSADGGRPLSSVTPPRWWQDERFGMFVHWGFYSVIGMEASWPLHSGQYSRAEYEGQMQRFNPSSFRADDLAGVAKRAGMKYLVLTTKHHDGFAMFDTKLSSFSVMHGPLKRDLVREVVEACRRAGLKVGFYFSLCDWHDERYAAWPKTGAWPFGRITPDPARWQEFVAFLHGQVRELLTNYGKVDVLWFDGGWEHTPAEWRAPELMAMIRKLQPGIVVNDRLPGQGDYATPEQTIPVGGMARPWETCMTINNTWGYNPNDHAYKPAADLIRNLCRTAGGGGNYLLNVGPKADGSVPPESVQRLEAMGAWLRVNGQAIYGTQAGPRNAYPAGAVTVKGKRAFVMVFGTPKEPVRVKLGACVVRAARLLHDRKPVAWRQDADAIEFDVEPERWAEDVSVIAIETDGIVSENVGAQVDANGTITLPAAAARIHGVQLIYQPNYDDLGAWMTPADWAEWRLRVEKPGEYRVVLECGVAPGQQGSAVAVRLGRAERRMVTHATSGWVDYRPFTIGTVRLGAGQVTVQLRCLALAQQAVLNLRAIRLVPVADGPAT